MTISRLASSRYLRVLNRQETDCTPIWIMRQAGRYLPQYRSARARAGNFLALCRNPQWACEVTLQPLEQFDLDAAILFSDILTIPDALNMGLEFIEGEGPKLQRPITQASDIDALPDFDASASLHYVAEATRLVVHELGGHKPLIGFAGSPWTLAVYMIEGGGSKDFRKARAFLYRDPQALHRLLQRLTDAVVDYLSMQITAGANAVQIFDTWGGILDEPRFIAFSLHYLRQIIARLRQSKNRVPITLFTKGGGSWLPLMADSGADALGVDWSWSMSRARQQVARKVALQGNLDPAALYAPLSVLRAEIQRIMDEAGTIGHIFNLGHGIHSDTDPKKVRLLVDMVHEYRP